MNTSGKPYFHKHMPSKLDKHRYFLHYLATPKSLAELLCQAEVCGNCGSPILPPKFLTVYSCVMAFALPLVIILPPVAFSLYLKLAPIPFVIAYLLWFYLTYYFIIRIFPAFICTRCQWRLSSCSPCGEEKRRLTMLLIGLIILGCVAAGLCLYSILP